jgi:hypothetical protein
MFVDLRHEVWPKNKEYMGRGREKGKIKEKWKKIRVGEEWAGSRRQADFPVKILYILLYHALRFSKLSML